VSVLPQAAKDLIRKKLIVHAPEKRITIDDLVASEYFDEVRDLTAIPEYDELHKTMFDTCMDFKNRHNVYKYEGQEKFNMNFFEKVRPPFQKVEEKDKMWWEEKLFHSYDCAMKYIYEEDPDEEKLEEEEMGGRYSSDDANDNTTKAASADNKVDMN